MNAHANWRRRAVVYQAYPKSFRDGNGDGVGDLKGLIEGLPHLARLGVDVLWLSPIFASPMVDNGYDMSDYTSVNPLFGTLEDVDALVAEARQRGIRIVLDIALNHSSTEHRWFRAAVAQPDSPFRDYYIWRDGQGDAPPNNWPSIFGGPAWTRPQGEGQYYLHCFDRTQADLNWANPKVREEIYAAMRFWLDRGIGGFRLDVVTMIAKPSFEDLERATPNGLFRHLATRPLLLDYLREMRREVFAHYDCISIGEAPGVRPADAAKLVNADDPMLDMIYHAELVSLPNRPDGRYDRTMMKHLFSAWEEGIGARGWNTVVLSNHDLGRIVSRFGDDRAYWRESTTALQTLVLLMRGTPFIYQGDELGMTNAPFVRLEDIDDVWAHTEFRLACEAGADEASAFAKALSVTRDHARTPYQWSAAANAGFAPPEARPWLQANPNHAQVNLEAQENDPASPLAYCRALIALRKTDPVWTDGGCAIRQGDPADAFVFTRALGGRTAVVAINLSSAPTALKAALPSYAPALANLPGPFAPGVLRPWEARVWDARVDAAEQGG